MYKCIVRILFFVALLAASAAQAGDAARIRLNFTPGVEHAFLYMAKEKGWYAAENIDLEITPGTGSTVAVKVVGSGESEFGIADAASVARGWEAGVPVVYIVMLLKETPVSIFSVPGKNIKTMRDLCGKKVGVNIKSAAAEQYKAMLRLANMKDCEIEEIPMSAGGTKEVLSGAVDAAANFVYTDALKVQLKAGGINNILAKDYFKLYSLGILTNSDLVKTNPDLVRRFTKATMRGLDYALSHPEEALATFAKITPEIDVEYEKAKLVMFKQLMTADDPSGRSIGKQSKEGWDATMKTLKEQDMIKTAALSAEGRYLPLPN